MKTRAQHERDCAHADNVRKERIEERENRLAEIQQLIMVCDDELELRDLLAEGAAIRRRG